MACSLILVQGPSVTPVLWYGLCTLCYCCAVTFAAQTELCYETRAQILCVQCFGKACLLTSQHCPVVSAQGHHHSQAKCWQLSGRLLAINIVPSQAE